ncbi:MAG: hypothetical protein IKO61_08540 [Lachnospiraceae bacterium]|nr:hypothetical protein [Lachnospiraceae bacterium]
MKKNIWYIIYIIVFVGALASLSLLMPFVKSDMSKEKRTAAAFPKPVTEKGINLKFFKQLDDYFSDNFAFRQELSTADALLKAKLFKTSNQERVVLGSDGWLYYSESMHDYLGDDVISKRRAWRTARVMKLLQEHCEKKGIKFLFTVAPNKHTLYPEHMPANYLKTDTETNYDLMLNAVGELEVNFIDLRAAFLSDDRVMYHKYDSHWNNEGATYAVDKMLNAVDKTHYSYESEPYRTEKVHRGDLYNIIYPSIDELDENVIYDKEHEYVYIGPYSDVEDPMLMTKCAGKEGSLVMFRDSYGNASIPYIADEYGDGTFTKGQPADLDLVDTKNADTVIYEIVERNIPWITEYVPYMDAPEREIEGMIEEAEHSDTTAHVEDRGKRYLIYGHVEDAFCNRDSSIYVRITDGDGNAHFYEAFPAEYEQSKEDYEGDNPYGMYIDKTLLPEGAAISVITYKNGIYYNHSVEVN